MVLETSGSHIGVRIRLGWDFGCVAYALGLSVYVHGLGFFSYSDAGFTVSGHTYPAPLAVGPKN